MYETESRERSGRKKLVTPKYTPHLPTTTPKTKKFCFVLLLGCKELTPSTPSLNPNKKRLEEGYTDPESTEFDLSRRSTL